jgi:hypothetical protein
MNERIETLAKAAGYDMINKAAMRALGFDVEKFAELIVADCLKQIKDGLVDESELLYEHEETTECVNEALMDAHHNIAIHFGFAEQFGVEQ